LAEAVDRLGKVDSVFANAGLPGQLVRIRQPIVTAPELDEDETRTLLHSPQVAQTSGSFRGVLVGQAFVQVRAPASPLQVARRLRWFRAPRPFRGGR